MLPTANPNHIPGIYNYCDRWCERCSFTTRCAMFARQQEGSPEQQDAQNEAFWNHLSENFVAMRQTLQQAAQQWGIDLDSLPEEEWAAIEQEQEDLRLRIKAHPLSKLTTQYYKAAEKFFKSDQLLEEDSERLMQQVEMGLHTEEEAHNLLVQVKDCLEVVQWYLFFIHTKFARALSGMMEDDGWEDEHGFPKDSDGSAKIALMAVQRSIQAWAHLLSFWPGKEDKILPLLALLQRIERTGHSTFPMAQSFVRPGFDTEGAEQKN